MKAFLRLYHLHRTSLLLLLGTWGLFFTVLFARTLKFTDDGLSVIHNNVWSDWALHISMASIFAHKAPQYWLSYHPIYADGQFTYGFLTNLISGLLMRLGFSPYAAFAVPSIAYSLLLIVGLYGLFCLLLRSQKQALVAISIFFLSSGPGFLKFGRDLWHGYSVANLLNPETNVAYSRVDASAWLAGNVIEGVILPQRAFLLGMTLSVWAMVGVLFVLLGDTDGATLSAEKGDRAKQATRRQNLILAGSAVLIGLLPLTHMHSFIVMFFVMGLVCIAAYGRWLQLFFYFVGPTAAISGTLVLIFISGGIEKSDFIQWYPGWTAEPGLLPWIILWLRIWGLMLPVAVVGQALLRRRSRIIQAFFAGFFLVFLIGNLFLFQPITWDNSKLFFWAYLGFSGLASVTLAWLWRRGSTLFSRLDTVVLALTLTLTGAIELARLQLKRGSDRPYISSQSDIQLGQAIRTETDPLARFLTAPAHNHPVKMWGARPILLGYTAWAFNFGFLYTQTEQDVGQMFLGGPEAERLMQDYRVSYVTIGPYERGQFEVDEAYFAENFPIAFQSDDYDVYDVRSLTQIP